MFARYKFKKRLKALIAKAGALGLPKKDQDFAYDYVEYNEPALALDQVAVQLYEFKISIDQECYDEITHITALMNIPLKEYDYLKELIVI